LLRTGFGELNGRSSLLVKFAEVFVFGRAKNNKKMADMDVGYSPVEPGRRVRATR